MPNEYINDALVRDLMSLVSKHKTLTGRELQHSALHIAACFYESLELDNFCILEEILKIFTAELQKELESSLPSEIQIN